MKFFRKSPSNTDKNRVDDRSERSQANRFQSGLGLTRGRFFDGLSDLFLGRKIIDDDLLELLEAQLLSADVGVAATSAILEKLVKAMPRRTLADGMALRETLKNILIQRLEFAQNQLNFDNAKPFVILVVGVNGAGKTTTIGKLAAHYKSEGHSVMLAAGDTFRAAAAEQLQEWGLRNDIPVIAQPKGADSASVLFDAMHAAKARGIDVLLADTAGRLNNKGHLMDELAKVVRVMGKQDSSAPHETLLVLDAGIGQNAVSQAVEFNAAIGVTGIALTKLDGTARGGVVFAIAQQIQRPIRFVGIGEGLHDLRPFDSKSFVDGLFAGVVK